MIAVDTSAVIAIGLREPGWEDCFGILRRQSSVLMSAVTLAEVLVVAAHRGVRPQMLGYLAALEPRVVPVDEPTARRVGEIYVRWGKGMHPARLNYCDCFSYDIARQFDCPLLYIGDDFSQTDIPSALA